MQPNWMSFGLACPSLVTAFYLDGLPQSDQAASANPPIRPQMARSASSIAWLG